MQIFLSVLGWFLGICFVITGFVNLRPDMAISCLIFLLIGLLLIPPISGKLKEITKISHFLVVKSVIIVLLLIISGTFAPDSELMTLKYKIMEKQDISYANNPRFAYRVLLFDKLPENPEHNTLLKQAAQEICKESSKKAECTVWFYTDETKVFNSAADATIVLNN